MKRACALFVWLAMMGLAAGCGGSSTPSGDKGANAPAKPSGATASADAPKAATVSTEEPAQPKRKFAPVKIGSSTEGSASNKPDEGSINSVLDAMQPLQVVLGKWRGITQKPLDGSVKIEEPEWIWDFKTNKDQPALTVVANSSPYFKSGRLTFLTKAQEFQFKATDKEGAERVYQGTFTEEPQLVAGEKNKVLQRTFKLTLKQIEPADDKKLAQVVFAQQENDRYLLQVFDKRGSDVLLVNTVANQREGTSFAGAADDYGEKKCVVSGGLGTSTVSYNGKTYYVCCSGCRAAFEDDPERWIAKFEASKKKSE